MNSETWLIVMLALYAAIVGIGLGALLALLVDDDRAVRQMTDAEIAQATGGTGV